MIWQDLLLVVGILNSVALAFNPNDYPPGWTIPPVNPEWTAVYKARATKEAPIYTQCLETRVWAFTFVNFPKKIEASFY